jgi:hypothetical protein
VKAWWISSAAAHSVDPSKAWPAIGQLQGRESRRTGRRSARHQSPASTAYSVTWAALRIQKTADSTAAFESPDDSQRRKGPKKREV